MLIGVTDSKVVTTVFGSKGFEMFLAFPYQFRSDLGSCTNLQCRLNIREIMDLNTFVFILRIETSICHIVLYLKRKRVASRFITVSQTQPLP